MVLPVELVRYPWGTCHVMETAHSDNRYLQCLLLQVGFQDMKDEMRRRHEKFRRDQVNATRNVLPDWSLDDVPASECPAPHGFVNVAGWYRRDLKYLNVKKLSSSRKCSHSVYPED